MYNYNLAGEPFGKRILVKPDPAEIKTKGGIWIPETAQERPSKGTVIQVGYDTELDKPLRILPGQEVLYGKYSGMEITFEDSLFILMFESDIIYAWPAGMEVEEN